MKLQTAIKKHSDGNSPIIVSFDKKKTTLYSALPILGGLVLPDFYLCHKIDPIKDSGIWEYRWIHKSQSCYIVDHF
jgi:hypothetical protein